MNEEKETKKFPNYLLWCGGGCLLIILLPALLMFGAVGMVIALYLIPLIVGLITAYIINWHTKIKNKKNIAIIVVVVAVVLNIAWAGIILSSSGTESTNNEKADQNQTEQISEEVDLTKQAELEKQKQEKEEKERLEKEEQRKAEEDAKYASPGDIVLSGIGQTVTDNFSLEKGLSVFNLVSGGSGHFSATLLDKDGNYIALLANDVGVYDGSIAQQVSSGEYVLDISADANWTITIMQPRDTRNLEEQKSFDGNGSKTTGLFKMTSGLKKIHMIHDGTGHFSVTLLDSKGNYIGLLSNDVGSFDGSKAQKVSDGYYIMNVSADGNWGINIE